MSNLLRESFLAAEVISVESYDYIIHPLLDGVPAVEPELLNEVTNSFFEMMDKNCDIIVAPEAMGLPLAASLSIVSGIPYTAIRKRSYGLPNEVKIHQPTGYSDREIYLNGIKKEDRVVIIDDVVSTGSTIRGIVNAIRGIGAEVLEVLVVADKGEHSEGLEIELDVAIKYLLRLKIKDGRIIID
ncbi:MAG: adenine phosphoribosyltransferase [Euryarchaeota archaeon]|nr:adenine phosphoribosyltransferase [Euryarchaeota archaeon]